jgi:hypothetical protein
LIIKTFDNIKDAWEGIYFGFLNDEPKVVDYFQRNIMHSHQNHIIARHAVMPFDLGDVGLTPTKWSKFTGQYVDVESLHAWVNNAMNVKTYDALWSFKLVPPNFSGQKAVHQWGNCLLGFSFRRMPKPATLTLYTRAQSIGFSGIADYALAHVVARYLAERMGVDPESIRFQIYCPNFILKTVETVHFLHYRGLLDEYMERDDRVGNAVRYYYAYMNRPEEEIKWRAARRMKHKLENSQAGIHRSMPVESLELRGWHAEKRINKGKKRLTSREASELVLTGKGRRLILPTDPIELEGPIEVVA